MATQGASGRLEINFLGSHERFPTTRFLWTGCGIGRPADLAGVPGVGVALMIPAAGRLSEALSATRPGQM